MKEKMSTKTTKPPAITASIVLSMVVLITLNLWVLSKGSLDSITADWMRSAGQACALTGFVLASINLFLSTKPLFLDRFFGGLDKAFRFHHLTGTVAFLLLVNHPLFFATPLLPDPAARLYLIPGVDFNYNLGITGLYLMIFAFLFIMVIRLPYHIWKFTHQLIGVGFLLGGVHSLLIGSDVTRYLPLGLWLGGFLALGVGSFLYSLMLYVRFGPAYSYLVTKVDQTLDTLHIYLAPQQPTPLPYQPAQFAYVSFRSDTVSPERHPFTLSSSPSDPFVRISAKMVGDYTLTLPLLSPQTPVTLWGPYGQFGTSLLNSPSPNHIWIAGGIGITPFMSLVRSLATTNASFLGNHAVTLFYTFRRQGDGIFLTELLETTKHFPSSFRLIPWQTSVRGRLTETDLLPLVADPGRTAIGLCGPVPMMYHYKHLFLIQGVPENNILLEAFALW